MFEAGVSTVKACAVFRRNVAYLYGPQWPVETPSQTTLSRWRQELGLLAMLHGAIVVNNCQSCGLHHDGSSKNQQKLAVCALKCKMEDGASQNVALGGVFTQSGGTAEEGKDQLLKCFQEAEEMLFSFHSASSKCKAALELIGPLPERNTLMASKVKSAMSDRAASALKTNDLLQQSLPAIITTSCQVHARTNTGSAAFKPGNAFLEKRLSPTRDGDEFASGGDIVSVFLRDLGLMFGNPTQVYPLDKRLSSTTGGRSTTPKQVS